jgi:hypothetical protein
MDAVPLSIRLLETRFHPYRLRKLPPDILDYVLFLPAMWLPCALGISLRLIGPLFLVIPLGFCLFYALLRMTIPPRMLSAYVAFCIVVAILSKYQLLPHSWQVHFREEAIIRQLVPLFGFFSVAWASKAYFGRRLRSGDPFFGAPIFLVLSMIVAPAVMFEQGLAYPGEDSAHAMLALYGALINNVLIAMLFITSGVFLTTDWRRHAGLVIILAIGVTSHFAQFKFVTLVVLATVLGAPGRIAAIVLVATLLGIYAVGIGHVPEAMLAGPASGIRLAFVRDAISSAVDTLGIGIGYGKESVRWRYQFPDMPIFTFLPDPSSMTPERMLEALSTGVENSFAEALLRTGVLGCALLVSAFFAAFPPRNLPRDVRNHAAIVFAILFLGCFVNSALESPLSAVGHAFSYGYLLALRASARTCTHAMVLGPVSPTLGAVPPLARPAQPPADSPT